jgi:hypothetical protein
MNTFRIFDLLEKSSSIEVIPWISIGEFAPFELVDGNLGIVQQL